MRRVTLVRHETSDQGTFGKIALPEGTFFTGELPWRDNDNDLSCVPTGAYECIMTYSPRFGRRLYLLGHVDRRTGVRIHPANLMGDVRKGFKSQLHGCIAVGEKIGWMNGQKSILVSAPAVRKLESIMELKPFILEVKNA